MRFPLAAIKEEKSGYKNAKSEKVAAIEKESESTKSDHTTKTEKTKKRSKKNKKEKTEDKSVEAHSPATSTQKPSLDQS